MRHTITGEKPWKLAARSRRKVPKGARTALFASIREGKPINDGEYDKSGLMESWAAWRRTRGSLDWDGLMKSKENRGRIVTS